VTGGKIATSSSDSSGFIEGGHFLIDCDAPRFARWLTSASGHSPHAQHFNQPATVATAGFYGDMDSWLKRSQLLAGTAKYKILSIHFTVLQNPVYASQMVMIN
jgi:hypothetical protein